MALAPDRLLVAARVDLTGGLDSEHVEELSTEIDLAIRDACRPSPRSSSTPPTATASAARSAAASV